MKKRNSDGIPPKVWRILETVSRLADERGIAAYAVGGFVRDLLLKRPLVDVDITVLGDGISFAQALASAVKGRSDAFTRFGTAIVVVPGFGKVDVTSARSETYERPGALPTVGSGDILQDLARRDFTINSMAFDLSPHRFLDLIDPYGGVRDLKNGLVRVHHEGSFLDDPTRIFRAVRFEQRFGKRLEAETERLLREALQKGCFDTVSGERLRNELILIFAEPHPEKAVVRLHEIGVLKVIHPRLGLRSGDAAILTQVPWALGLFDRSGKPLDERWMIWFQALLGGLREMEAEALSGRLLLSRNERKIVLQRATAARGVRARLSGEKLPFSRIHELLAPLVNEVQCFVASSLRPGPRKRVEAYYRRVTSMKPFLRGKDLQKLGVPPGFQYSFLLQKAFAFQLDGEFRTKKHALKWARGTHARQKK